jgi:hypothetical protein
MLADNAECEVTVAVQHHKIQHASRVRESIRVLVDFVAYQSIQLTNVQRERGREEPLYRDRSN